MPSLYSQKDDIDLASLNGLSNMANHDGQRQLPIMVRTPRKTLKPFWPFMELWGLHRKRIDADGNCLFRALSDQMYDTTDRHDEIRQKVVTYLRENRESFEPFVPFDTEDLVRSQPSTRSSRSRRVNVDNPYEAYLENMAKSKTWGGEIEITAFCEAYNKDVIIHRPTDAGQPFDQKKNNKRAAGQPKEFVHVSFGGESNHPHYESVRPINAAKPPAPPWPHTSRPQTRSSLGAGADRGLTLADYNQEPLHMIEQAGPTISADELHCFLENSRSQVDAIVAHVINSDRDRSSSASSASRRSSSSKRSREDEDDDESDRASKRAQQRITLGNRTSVFVTSVAVPSSSKGTEICDKARIDTPPGPVTDNQTRNKDASEEREALEGKNAEQEECETVEEEAEKVPDSTGKSTKREVKDGTAQSRKAQVGKGMKNTRVKNP